MPELTAAQKIKHIGWVPELKCSRGWQTWHDYMCPRKRECLDLILFYLHRDDLPANWRVVKVYTAVLEGSEG